MDTAINAGFVLSTGHSIFDDMSQESNRRGGAYTGENCIYGEPFAIVAPAGLYVSAGTRIVHKSSSYSSGVPILAPIKVAAGQTVYLGHINFDVFYTAGMLVDVTGWVTDFKTEVTLEWPEDKLRIAAYFPGIDLTNTIVPKLREPGQGADSETSEKSPAERPNA